MASRSLEDLNPEMRERAEDFLGLAHDHGFEVLIYCTYRSFEAQARLYRQGRPTWQIHETADELSKRYGRPDLAEILIGVGPQYERVRRTNAAPGQSMHNYGLAFDAVPMVDGKCVWGTTDPEDKAMWAAYGHLVESAHLEWSGRWVAFKEYPHAQIPDVDWRELIREAAGDGS